MRTLNEIIASVLDQLAPLPSGPLTPLDTPDQDANRVSMAEFGIEPPVYQRPAALPRTVEELERLRARQLLVVRLGEMIRVGEVLPRDRQTGDTVRDLGWEVQLSDYDRLVLDDADEGRFRSRYPALQTPSDDVLPTPSSLSVSDETPERRGERLAQRRDELKRQNVRDWQKRIAREEGVSVERIKQILGKHDKRATQASPDPTSIIGQLTVSKSR